MTAPEPTPRWTLHHDKQCMLCRTLAALIQGSRVAVEPLDRPGDDIRLITPDGITLSGTDAWQALLDLHPALKTWSWLAAKLGLEKKEAAVAIRGAAHRLRSLCPKCKPVLPVAPARTEKKPFRAWSDE